MAIFCAPAPILPKVCLCQLQMPAIGPRALVEHPSCDKLSFDSDLNDKTILKQLTESIPHFTSDVSVAVAEQ